MTEGIEEQILSTIGSSHFAYIEADYFGGEGGQTAVIWVNSERFKVFPYGQNVINEVLKHFGTIAESLQDEFATVGLGSHRHTQDWLEDQSQITKS